MASDPKYTGKISYPESFADFPVSTTEKRGKNDARHWTPRDALISMLRRIDSGEIPNVDALMIVLRAKEDDAYRTYFSQATPDFHTSLGMLEHLKYRLHSDG